MLLGFENEQRMFQRAMDISIVDSLCVTEIEDLLLFRGPHLPKTRTSAWKTRGFDEIDQCNTRLTSTLDKSDWTQVDSPSL